MTNVMAQVAQPLGLLLLQFVNSTVFIHTLLFYVFLWGFMHFSQSYHSFRPTPTLHANFCIPCVTACSLIASSSKFGVCSSEMLETIVGNRRPHLGIDNRL